MLVTLLGVLMLLELASAITFPWQSPRSLSTTTTQKALDPEERDEADRTDWHDWTSPIATATITHTDTTITIVESPVIVVSSGITSTSSITFTESTTNSQASSQNSEPSADNGSTGMPAETSSVDSGVATSATYFPDTSRSSSTSSTLSWTQSPQVIVVPGKTTFTTETWVTVSSPAADSTTSMASPSTSDQSEGGQSISGEAESTKTSATTKSSADSTGQGGTSASSSTSTDSAHTSSASETTSRSSTSSSTMTESSSTSTQSTVIGTLETASTITSSTAASASSSSTEDSSTADTFTTSASTSAAVPTSPTSSRISSTSSTLESSQGSSSSQTTQPTSSSENSSGSSISISTTSASAQSTTSAQTAQTSSSFENSSGSIKSSSITPASAQSSSSEQTAQWTSSSEYSSDSRTSSSIASASAQGSSSTQAAQSTSSSENSAVSITTSSTTSASAQGSSSGQTAQAISTTSGQSSCPFASETVEPITTSYTYLSAGGTYTTVFVATVDLCDDINSFPSIPPSPEPTVPSTIACSYDAVPWCVTDQALTATSACLCPVCVGGFSQCALAKPTDTSSCPTEYGWLCSVTVDPGLSSAAHSLPPGFAWITPGPSSTTTEPWYRHTSTLHATKGTSKSDAPFNATRSYWTASYSNGDRVVHPYRAWHCVAGAVCFKPDTDFSKIDFGCWFKKLFILPLAWKDCIAKLVFGDWFRPKIPFPPPIGPEDLNFELQLTTYPGGGGNPITGPVPAGMPPAPPPPTPTQPTTSPTASRSSSSSSSSSSESCTEPTATWSVCSTFCSTYTTTTSVTTEGCSSTCTTYSGCSGADTSTATTAAACSISPYWDDPAIASSLSSLFDSFPFTFPDSIELTLTTNGSSVTSTTASTSTGSPSTTSSTPTTFSTTSPLRPSITPTPTSSKSISSTSSAPTVALPARTQACYDFDDKKDEYGYGEVYCEYQESEKVGGHFEAFIWEITAGKQDGIDVAASPVGQFCDSLKKRKVVITSDPDAKPWAPKSPAECNIDPNAAEAVGHNILMRVGRSDAGCKKKDGKCIDGYCDQDLDFSSYSTEQCRDHFANAIRAECYGKGFDVDESQAEAGKPNSFGGSFFTDCMMWTIVAGEDGVIPNRTDGSN